MKKKHLLTTLAIALPLLSACSSIGLARERYDGRKVERHEEVSAAYNENREIIGDDKEKYVNDSLIHFLSGSALPFPDEEIYLPLSTEYYKVGQDIPEGRYQVMYEGLQPEDDLTVRDQNGEVLYEFPLGFMIQSFELNLYEGQSIEGSTPENIAANVLVSERIVPPVFQGYTPDMVSQYVSDVENFTFDNGVWYVGEHLPAGTYHVQVPALYSQYVPHIYVYQSDGEIQVHELLGTFGSEEIFLELKLDEDNALLIENSPALTFVPTETGN